MSSNNDSAIGKIKYLLFNQLFTRLITFTLNLLVARQVGPAIYGYATVHLHLPYTIVLFLCREGLRRACVRYKTVEQQQQVNAVNNVTSNISASDAHTKQYETQNVINITWLYTLLSIPVTYLTLLMFAQLPTDLHDSVDYDAVLKLYTYSALIEMLSEPMYILAARQLRVELRVLVDSVSVTLRCIAIYVLIQLNYGVYAYVYAQLMYTTCITLLYTVDYIRHNQSLSTLLPRRLSNTLRKTGSQYIESELWLLTRNFTVQSVEKLVLTEGEKFILVAFHPNLDDHGVYSLVANIGSLVARFVFQPIEESAYAEFSVTLNRSTGVGRQAYETAAHLLRVLLKFVITLSALLVVVGPQYSYTFFELLYGPVWSHTAAPTALSYYFVYILVISLNGVTESFVFASISAQQLVRYNVWLFAFSAVYVMACIVLVQYGVVGLIVANSVNMACRIVYSCVYIHNTVAIHTSVQHAWQMWRLTGPSVMVCAALCAASVGTTTSYYSMGVGVSKAIRSYPAAYAVHVAVGGLCTAVVGAAVYVGDRAYVRELVGLFKRKAK